MTICSPNQMDGWDKYFWRKVSDLTGKITSLDELVKIYPKLTVIENEEKKIIYYGFIDEHVNYVAYRCLDCNNIIYGPPKKMPFDNLETVHLAGAIGEDIYCHSCRSCIGKEIKKMS